MWLRRDKRQKKTKGGWGKGQGGHHTYAYIHIHILFFLHHRTRHQLPRLEVLLGEQVIGTMGEGLEKIFVFFFSCVDVSYVGLDCAFVSSKTLMLGRRALGHNSPRQHPLKERASP